MCFHLYAGTEHPLPRSEFDAKRPRVNVRDLKEYEAPLLTNFTKPEVQFVGSSTGCGCAFPNVMQSADGSWLYWLDPKTDAETINVEREECVAICELLATVPEEVVELYGIWAGGESEAPAVLEEITLNEIRAKLFRFKEGGFYRVKLRGGEHDDLSAADAVARRIRNGEEGTSPLEQVRRELGLVD